MRGPRSAVAGCRTGAAECLVHEAADGARAAAALGAAAETAIDLAGRARPLHLDEERGDERSFLAGLLGIYAAWTIAGTFETHLPKGFGPAIFGTTFGDAYAREINQLLFACLEELAIENSRLRKELGNRVIE